MSKESKQPYKESSQADVQPSEAIVFKSQLKPEGGSFNSLHIPDEILTEFMDNFINVDRPTKLEYRRFWITAENWQLSSSPDRPITLWRNKEDVIN